LDELLWLPGLEELPCLHTLMCAGRVPPQAWRCARLEVLSAMLAYVEVSGVEGRAEGQVGDVKGDRLGSTGGRGWKCMCRWMWSREWEQEQGRGAELCRSTSTAHALLHAGTCQFFYVGHLHDHHGLSTPPLLSALPALLSALSALLHSTLAPSALLPAAFAGASWL